MQKYIFVGNRFLVLEKMMKMNLHIEGIFCYAGSFLEKELIAKQIGFTSFQTKSELIKLINNIKFDVLVSNGCPFILPVTDMKNQDQVFVNIHPSLLPDLKGKNPINGALLFKRKHGVTCHLMDDGIDSGDIISQIEIPVSADMDLGLLYKTSFLAEGDVFEMAYCRQFKPTMKTAPANSDYIYYSRNENDLMIDFSDSPNNIVNQIKAFGIIGQGAYFCFSGQRYTVMDATLIENEYLNTKLSLYQNREIIFKYDNNIMVKSGEHFIKLLNIQEPITNLIEGQLL